MLLIQHAKAALISELLKVQKQNKSRLILKAREREENGHEKLNYDSLGVNIF